MNNLSGYLNFKDNKINELKLKSIFQNNGSGIEFTK